MIYSTAPIAISTTACPFLTVKPRPTPTQIGERALENLARGRVAKSLASERLREEIRAIWIKAPGLTARAIRSRLKRKRKPSLRQVQRLIKLIKTLENR